MPEAEFDVITIQAYTGVPVEFDNKSEKAKSYRWDFGDGSNSTKEKPVHTYARSGNYNVTLEAIRNNRSDFYSQPVVVELDLEKKMLSWGEDRIPGISLFLETLRPINLSGY